MLQAQTAKRNAAILPLHSACWSGCTFSQGYIQSLMQELVPLPTRSPHECRCRTPCSVRLQAELLSAVFSKGDEGAMPICSTRQVMIRGSRPLVQCHLNRGTSGDPTVLRKWERRFLHENVAGRFLLSRRLQFVVACPPCKPKPHRLESCGCVQKDAPSIVLSRLGPCILGIRVVVADRNQEH